MPDFNTKTRSVSNSPPLHSKQGQSRLAAPERDPKPAPKKPAAGNAKLAAKATPQGLAYTAGKKIGSGVRGAAKPKGRLSASNPTRLLMLEFLICFAVLGAGTIVAPQGSKDGIPRLMTRGTGLALLFFILSLTSAGGPKAGRAAAGLGGLVTAAYLFTSSDATNVMKWMSQFFSPGGTGAAGAGAAAGAAAGAPSGAAGSVGDIVGTGADLIGTVYGGGLGGDAGAGAGTTAPPANPGGGNKQGLL
jgi:hypothetical protein